MQKNARAAHNFGTADQAADTYLPKGGVAYVLKQTTAQFYTPSRHETASTWSCASLHLALFWLPLNPEGWMWLISFQMLKCVHQLVANFFLSAVWLMIGCQMVALS